MLSTILMTSCVLLLLGVFGLPVITGHAPAAGTGNPDMATGSAFGIDATLLGSSLVSPTPSVTLPANGQTTTASGPSASATTLVSTGTLNVSTGATHIDTAAEVVTSSATVHGLNGASTLATLGAGSVSSTCTSNNLGATGSTTVSDLDAGGSSVVLPSTIPPNYQLSNSQLGSLAGVVSVTLNAQAVSNVRGSNSITVDGMEISPLSGVDSGAVFLVSDSRCGASGPDIDPVPAVSSLSPSAGPTAGGTSVTITGTGFTDTPGSPTVDFGTTPASGVAVVSPTEISATSPTASQGSVDVRVDDPYGTSAAVPEDTFTYVAPPSIAASGISPDSGPTGGGTTVTIMGAGFSPAGGTPTVDFGSGASPIVRVVTPNEITAASPPRAAGQVPVAVTDAGGTSNSEPFTYVVPAPGAPSIDRGGVSPSAGPTSGGTTVALTGSGFPTTGATPTVEFGTTPATGVKVASPSELTAVSPSGAAGAVEVSVSDREGTSNGEPFTYETGHTTRPTVSGITPTSGTPAGGNTIEIVGSNLCHTVSIRFGQNHASQWNVNGACTQLNVAVPGGSGTVPVSLTTDAGRINSAYEYTYIDPGYWMAASDGGLFSYGGARFYGSMGSRHLNAPIVAMADTPDHGGYWLFAADGGVFAFGDARFHGSVPETLGPEGRTLNAPVVAAEATPDGKGYRLFAADGGVFDFGDAQFVGSVPDSRSAPNAPVKAGASTPVGQGYWLTGSDGSVYVFGNARYYDSVRGRSPNSRITAMSATSDGGGYWLMAQDGAVFAMGDAKSYGSMSGKSLDAPIAFGTSTTTAHGYWLFGTDGGVYAFGDAPFLGSLGGTRLNAPIVGGMGF
jgi:IPT/TIG domain